MAPHTLPESGQRLMRRVRVYVLDGRIEPLGSGLRQLGDFVPTLLSSLSNKVVQSPKACNGSMNISCRPSLLWLAEFKRERFYGPGRALDRSGVMGGRTTRADSLFTSRGNQKS